MTTLSAIDISPKVVALASCRTIREVVTEECIRLTLDASVTSACVKHALSLHSAKEGKLMAQRVHDKLRAVRSRFPYSGPDLVA